MSYNVDSIEVIAQDNFRLPVEFIAALRKEIGDDFPELWLLYEDAHPDNNSHFEDVDSYRYFRRINWQGDGSGYSWDKFTDVVLPKFKGSADLLVCWEGGDSYSGLRIRDGKVARHRVVMTLGEEEKP